MFQIQPLNWVAMKKLVQYTRGFVWFEISRFIDDLNESMQASCVSYC